MIPKVKESSIFYSKQNVVMFKSLDILKGLLQSPNFKVILEVVQQILELPAELEAVPVLMILKLTDRNESTVVAQIERGGLIPDLSLLKM